ncbi:ead/Ea22-like family protein [Salmonella enterica subsp. enterica serovar Muenchen]|nr:ead/Ea22-like family protein [Salmonella enterica subsp. enterica serovar Muenchen]
MSNKIVFVNGKSKCGCVMAFSDGGGEYSDVHTIIPCAEHSMPESALTQRDDMRQVREQLEEAEKRIVELSRAASVNSQWKPDVCPVTGRQFFMWIEHETLGYVPTYGGPFDSYTIPTRDSSGEFSCERYDHDLGGWVGGEFIGLYLIDDDEQCRVSELEERIAELEARKVNLSKLSVGEVMYVSGFSRDYAEGWCAGNDNAIHEIRTAGIKVKEL